MIFFDMCFSWSWLWQRQLCVSDYDTAEEGMRTSNFFENQLQFTPTKLAKGPPSPIISIRQTFNHLVKWPIFGRTHWVFSSRAVWLKREASEEQRGPSVEPLLCGFHTERPVCRQYFFLAPSTLKLDLLPSDFREVESLSLDHTQLIFKRAPTLLLSPCPCCVHRLGSFTKKETSGLPCPAWSQPLLLSLPPS